MKVQNSGTWVSAGSRVSVTGELVPIVEVELGSGSGLFFESHTLLSKDPRVKISAMPVSGMVKRMIAGLPLIVVQAAGPGRASFSRDGVGEAIVLEMDGREVDVMEHRFLLATSNVSYGCSRVKGLCNIFGSGSGFFVDRFTGRDGLLVLHGYGNVVELELGTGEAVEVEPSAWLYKDATLQMQTFPVGLSTGLFGSTKMWMTRFTGPGRIAYQSLTPQVVSSN